jgi:CBS domain-containing protein
MKVKDVMHKGVDWVSPDTPVTELAKLMREHDIGAIPIGENDRLIGMVTDRDIVCKGLAQDSFDAGRATALDVMTPGIHCCRDDDDLAKAVRHMEQLQVRRLPVINKSKRMVGILSLQVSEAVKLCLRLFVAGAALPTVAWGILAFEFDRSHSKKKLLESMLVYIVLSISLIMFVIAGWRLPQAFITGLQISE